MLVLLPPPLLAYIILDWKIFLLVCIPLTQGVKITLTNLDTVVFENLQIVLYRKVEVIQGQYLLFFYIFPDDILGSIGCGVLFEPIILIDRVFWVFAG